ncbi:hypothetical protein VTL71DRAFT_8756 [Oculimacula yallundae]|uniref:N-acetyltransferase domain-containing protein n=1 Tax=Oculimacula yallundae TaxID=86028 RepID=A0ABR4CZP2_9HELO
MSSTEFTTALATEDDGPALASIMTAAFSHSDAAYPLIWASADEGTHDRMCIMGLFTPVQKSDRVTYKIMDDEIQKAVGFATWTLPKESPESKDRESQERKGGLPSLPGVNIELWMDKVGGTRGFSERDVDKAKDMELSFCFVHPQYQRKGIASSLLRLGCEEADARNSRFWCTSTHQAVSTYVKNGWKVVEKHDVDLSKYGGDGIYTHEDLNGVTNSRPPLILLP